MKHKDNKINLTKSGLSKLGKKSNIPFSQRVSAQVILSREQVDILLAQKATDLVLKDAKDDLQKYLPAVVVNEMEILTQHLKKETLKVKVLDEESEENLSQMIKRLHKLLTKHFPSGIGEVDKDFILHSGIERGTFEIELINFTEQYFKFTLRKQYSKFEYLNNEIDFILPFRNMIKDEKEIRAMDVLFWSHHLNRYVDGLITDVIYPLFSNQVDYNSPIDPGYDPEWLRHQYSAEILLSFICNPIYKNEELNKKARNNIWICKIFDNIAAKAGPREEKVLGDSGIPKLKSLLFNFLKGRIKEEDLSVNISKIQKEIG